MNLRKIKSLISSIQSSDEIELNDQEIGSNIIGSLENDPSHIILELIWEDDGYEFEAFFTEESLDNAIVSGNGIVLKDVEGDDCTIYLRKSIPIVIDTSF